MNDNQFWRRLATALVIVCLLLLVGCGGLGGSSSPTTAAAAVSVANSSLSFGTVAVGSSMTVADSIANNTSSSVTVSSIAGLGSGFQVTGVTLPLVLAAGQSASFNVKFQPAAAGTSSVTISFEGQNGQTLVSLSASASVVAAGTQGTLSPSPASLAFGNVQAGGFGNLSETLTNTGASAATISQANLTGAAFSISGLTLPLTLTPNGSVTFTATFAPSSAGAASGNLSLVSNASNSPLVIALSGAETAAGQLAVSPGSLSFGSVVVGSSSSLTGSLTASGSSITVTSASLNNSEFAVSGISLPATISAGQPASFTVTFTPQSSGSTSASLSFSSNASNSPASQSISMTGTGTAPVQHSVDLAWTASTDAVGYNIYRGTASGGPYAVINSSLESTTAYTDDTVVSGQTYYYVVTAVDSDSNESGYSNQAQAVIPSP